MAGHLVAHLFTSHGAGWPEAGQPVRVRIDQVLLDEDVALPTLLAFESLGRAAHACALALVAPAREAEGPDAVDDLRYLQSTAAACGASFVRPGAGPPAAIHRRGFAGPGRTLLASAPGAAGAGAFASLALEATPAEIAAALAGEPLLLERPPVIGVALRGAPRPGVGGAEIVVHLARMLDRAAQGAILECFGEPLEQLGMPERIALAALAPVRLGVRACVLASDAVTRAYLAERGRDADWRRAEAGGGGYERALELDLGRVAPPERREGRVRFGAEAEDDDLRRLAAAARAGASLAAAEVVVGGRAARRSLGPGGVFESLEAAGAAVWAHGEARAHAPLEPGSLACGDDAEVRAGRATPASVRGALHALGIEAPADETADASGAPLDPAEVLAPAAGETPPAPERGAAHAPSERAAAFEGSPRGIVRFHTTGDLPGERILAWGPRAQARRGDPGALAALAFDGLVVPATASPTRPRFDFAVANGRWGEGARDEATARALVALGIRVVIAREYAPGHTRVLAVHGVLPLLWRRAVDARRVALGDELELPAIGEASSGAERVTLRSLSRGQAFDADPAAGPCWIEVARAGGTLSALAAAHSSGA